MLPRAFLLVAVLACVAEAQRVPLPTVTIADSPKSVMIGEPFVVTVTVVAPAGATVSLPIAADSGSPVRFLSPAVAQTVRDADSSVTTARFTLAAWDTQGEGKLGEVVVAYGGVAEHFRLALPDLAVSSVLPAPPEELEPRTARDFLDEQGPWPYMFLVSVLLLVVLASLAIWLRYFRGRSAHDSELPPTRVAPPDFSGVHALRLLERGEYGSHVIAMTDALVACCSGRIYAHKAGTKRSRESRASEEEDLTRRLRRLLDRAAEIKYGRGAVTLSEATMLSQESEDLAEALYGSDGSWGTGPVVRENELVR